jgi:gluconolactonase
MKTERNESLGMFRLKWAFGVVFFLGLAGTVVGQTIPKLGGEYERLYTTDIVPGWLEGPAYDGAGGVWFSELLAPSLVEIAGAPSNARRFDIATGATELKIDSAGGIDGLAFDADRNLIAAHVYDHNLTRRPVDSQGNIVGDVTVLADRWDGEDFKYTNDLVIDGKGGIYFTDPDPTLDPAGNAVYYISPTRELQQVSTGLAFNNGIGLAPDDEILYVLESGFGVKYGAIIAFDVNDDGSLANQRVLAEPPPSDERSFAPDGMTVDRFGNVYSSDLAFGLGAGGPEPGLPGSKIRVFDSAGEEILTVEPPEGVINLTFVPPDGDMLYFTSEKSLWRVPITFVPEPAGLLLLTIALGSSGLVRFRRGNRRP